MVELLNRDTRGYHVGIDCSCWQRPFTKRKTAAPPGFFLGANSRCRLNLLHMQKTGPGACSLGKFLKLKARKRHFLATLRVENSAGISLNRPCHYFRKKSRKSLKTHQITKFFSHNLICTIVAISSYASFQAYRVETVA